MLLVELEPAIDPVDQRARDPARLAPARAERPRRSRRRARVFDGRRSLRSAADRSGGARAGDRARVRRRSRRSRRLPSAAGDRDSRQLRRRVTVPISMPSRRSPAARPRRSSSGTASAPIASTCSGSFRASPTWAASIRRLPRRGTACRASACRPARSASPDCRPASIPVESPGGWQLIGHTDDRDVRRRIAISRACSRPAISCDSCRQAIDDRRRRCTS